MNDEETVLCCVAIEDLPIPEPGSVRSVCQDCEIPIWISLKGIQLVERQPKTRILCTRCVLVDGIDPEQFRALPDEDRELTNWLEGNKKRVHDLLRRRLGQDPRS